MERLTKVLLIVITIIHQTNAIMFFRDKQRDLSEIVLEYVKKQSNAFVNIMQTFIIAHTVEIVTLMVIIVTIVYILKKMYDGRPSYNTLFIEDQEAKESKAICITNNITTTTNTSNGDVRDSASQNNRTIDITSMIKQPQSLDHDTDIPTWIETMETYLETCNKENWYKIAISYINHSIIKKINLISINNSEGTNRYDHLKNQLLLLNNQDENKVKEVIKLNFKTMGERKQNKNETIEEYGTSLIEMARVLLPLATLNMVEEILKQQFADGISNKEIAQQVKLKIYEKERKQKQFNLTDTINFAKDLNRSYETKTNIGVNDEQEAKDLTICNISNNKQEIEQNYVNHNYNNRFNNNKNTTHNLQQNQSYLPNNQSNYRNNHKYYNNPYNNGRHQEFHINK